MKLEEPNKSVSRVESTNNQNFKDNILHEINLFKIDSISSQGIQNTWGKEENKIYAPFL